MTLFLLSFLGCGDEDPSSDTPACITELAEEMANAPVANPPSSITESVIDGERYYYIPAACCDQYSDLLDDRCNMVCHPDGGQDGGGSGTCPDLDAATSTRVIWQDDREL